jgi:hypothetical protein
VYIVHEKCQAPSDENTKIWRYMDFTKFISLLDKQATFFVRAGKLSDPFEGAHPRPVVKPWDLVIWDYMSYIKHTEMVAVNCWHRSDYESAAMWKLYLKSDEGIAIQSTFGRLTRSFEGTSREVCAGIVSYLDYDSQPLSSDNILTFFLHKRRSFDHEQELRAMVIIPTISEGTSGILPGEFITDDGIYVPTNLDVLIEEVFVSPTSQPWFMDLIKSVTEKYGLRRNVRQSKLAGGPVY